MNFVLISNKYPPRQWLAYFPFSSALRFFVSIRTNKCFYFANIKGVTLQKTKITWLHSMYTYVYKILKVCFFNPNWKMKRKVFFIQPFLNSWHLTKSCAQLRATTISQSNGALPHLPLWTMQLGIDETAQWLKFLKNLLPLSRWI